MLNEYHILGMISDEPGKLADITMRGFTIRHDDLDSTCRGVDGLVIKTENYPDLNVGDEWPHECGLCGVTSHITHIKENVHRSVIFEL